MGNIYLELTIHTGRRRKEISTQNLASIDVVSPTIRQRQLLPAWQQHEEEECELSSAGASNTSVPTQTTAIQVLVEDTNFVYARDSRLLTVRDPQPSSVSCIDAANCFLPTFSTLTRNMLFSAILQNALRVGFDLDQLSSCREDYLSPFYDPRAAPRELSLRTTTTTTTQVDSIPMHLQPSMIQKMIPHHASLDLVPLPHFRDKAILLCAALPHLFNLRELKSDIYSGCGLVAWRKHSMCSQTHTDGGDCEPWTQENWEAAPWFLRKWSIAMEGDNGAMLRQSVFWRRWRAAKSSEHGVL